MAKLPEDTRLKIEKEIEDGLIEQDFRPYLGMSSIGEECARKLWYGFRLALKKKITPRQHRLFQRGHREEGIIQADFRKIGMHHYGDQKEVVHGNGHIRGHIDDLLDGLPDAPKTTHLGEYKTHNDKSFKNLKKDGMRKSKPVHFAQMNCYMHLLELKRGLYVAVNKNDDERYYERIAVDPGRAEDLLQKGVDIISTDVPPARCGNSTWYACKWCDYYEICHFGADPLKTCRTCKNVNILDDGKWECGGFKLELSFQQQQLGCGRYKLIETFRG